MNTVATDAGVVLGVSGKDINELYDTVAAIEKLGNKNLVLDTTGADIKETFANTVQVRRAALKGYRTEHLVIRLSLTWLNLRRVTNIYRQHLLPCSL